MARRDIGTDDPRVRVRPARSKPRRSKKQVDYSASPTAFVFAVDRGRIHVQMGDTKLVGVKARALGRHGIVVGDQVRVTGDLSGKSGSLARIVEVLPRQTELTRSAEDSPGAKEKPMVANANQMAIVTACADPLPRPGMIDRLLVAAYCAGIEPLLLVTKSDLTSPEPLLELFQPLQVPSVVTSIESGEGIDEAAELLAGRVSVLVGHSGVGKSSLMNTLIPDAARSTGHVNQVTGRGRHTSTSVMALPYQDGWLIDTPGIRSFGLAHISEEDLLAAFPDLAEVATRCPKLCPHLQSSPGCQLSSLEETDPAQERRVESFRRLLASQHSQNTLV
ncbi:ribosome small subunit-dependent GTPase A [Varibaculum cambriense]|uniref:ribosome small subunit-dependent GTPase A n=1 Tax=Varibaculum cambriense TaxID=184870 RepID=UPI00241CEF98|nr:ribosome small subunit-dependent GTPase A [Varibaculum cambriense]MBS5944707.1 ribosome small subunit-dependent GTPase A [Varibaculum cambriense]